MEKYKVNLRRRDLKSSAKKSLQGNWDLAIVTTLLYFIFAELPLGMSNAFFRIAESNYTYDNLTLYAGGWSLIFSTLVTGAFILGLTLTYLNLARNQTSHLRDFFSYFTSGNRFVRSVAYFLLNSIYIFLWSLLFIIPGIVKSFSYAMTPYILNDNPEFTVNEAITRSRSMMHGYKWDLFVLNLSFLGWFLLGVFTLGLALFYVYPYYNATYVQFYEQLKGKSLEEL